MPSIWRLAEGSATLPDPAAQAGEAGGLQKRRSAVGEGGLALFDESRHAFLLVVEGEGRVESATLEQQTFGQRALVGAVDAFLDHHHHRQREAGNAGGRRHRLFEQFVGGHDARNEAGALGFLSVDVARGEAHFHRLGLGDRARQALGATGTGQDAEADFGLAKLRIVGGQDDVAHHRQFAAAAEYWSRLLELVEPGSEEANALTAAIGKAREFAATQASGTAKPGASAGVVSGEVTLSGKLAGMVQPGDVLFVFARAEEGPRMPLAAKRASVADLPLRFQFDDSMALAGGKKISDFATIRIEARVARAGQAQSSSGDLFGTLSGVKPGSRNLRVLIDQVQP